MATLELTKMERTIVKVEEIIGKRAFMFGYRDEDDDNAEITAFLKSNVNDEDEVISQINALTGDFKVEAKFKYRCRTVPSDRLIVKIKAW